MLRAAFAARGYLASLCGTRRERMDWDWPWWLMFLAAMLSSYLRELQLRKERNDPRCTLFYTSHLKNGSPSTHL